MDITTTITPEEVAAEMRSDPKFGMQVLALFTQEPSPLDTANFAEAGAENMYHEQTAPLLHLLADDIIEALEG